MKAATLWVHFLYFVFMPMAACSYGTDVKGIYDTLPDAADRRGEGPMDITITNTTKQPVTLFYLDPFSDMVSLNIAPQRSMTLQSQKAVWLTNNHYKYGTVYLAQPMDSLALSLSAEGDYQLTPHDEDNNRKNEIDAFRYVNARAGQSYFESLLNYKTKGDRQRDFTNLNSLFEARYQREKALLDQYLSTRQVSAAFATKARQLLLLELYSKKLNYLWYHKALVSTASAFRQEFEATYTLFKQEAAGFSDFMALYKNIAYSYFIRQVQYDLGIKPFEGDQFQKPPSDSLYNAVLEQRDLGAQRDQYLFLIVKEELLKNPESTQSCITRFFVDCQSEVLTGYIQNIISTRQLAARTNRDILIDNKNEQKGYRELLASLKGNVVYIDVWASWCMPCRAEMEMENKLIAEYQSKPIRFLLISEDANINAWMSASKQESLDTYRYNFLLPDFENSDFRKSFNITTIPRYILLDKNGKVVNADAPRPSDPSLRPLLDKMLE